MLPAESGWLWRLTCSLQAAHTWPLHPPVFNRSFLRSSVNVQGGANKVLGFPLSAPFSVSLLSFEDCGGLEAKGRQQLQLRTQSALPGAAWRPPLCALLQADGPGAQGLLLLLVFLKFFLGPSFLFKASQQAGSSQPWLVSRFPGGQREKVVEPERRSCGT